MKRNAKAIVLPGARETACMSSGAHHHEFSCRWGLKSAGTPARSD